MSPVKDPLRFFVGAGALSGLVSIGFHSFFDFNLEMPANAVYFVMLMAIVCACTQRTEGRSRMSVVRGQTPEDGGRPGEMCFAPFALRISQGREVGSRIWQQNK